MPSNELFTIDVDPYITILSLQNIAFKLFVLLVPRPFTDSLAQMACLGFNFIVSIV